MYILESVQQFRVRSELCFDVGVDVVLVIPFMQLHPRRRWNCRDNIRCRLTCDENVKPLTVLQEFQKGQNTNTRVSWTLIDTIENEEYRVCRACRELQRINN